MPLDALLGFGLQRLFALAAPAGVDAPIIQASVPPFFGSCGAGTGAGAFPAAHAAITVSAHSSLITAKLLTSSPPQSWDQVVLVDVAPGPGLPAAVAVLARKG
ncbi:hypothetical protein EDC01DRAFT_774847 [Geopyxis carbonaria]|nr:hypothetical protein EDC01DRAFT_774847 [Geopyxis carbonaria]